MQLRIRKRVVLRTNTDTEHDKCKMAKHEEDTEQADRGEEENVTEDDRASLTTTRTRAPTISCRSPHTRSGFKLVPLGFIVMFFSRDLNRTGQRSGTNIKTSSSSNACLSSMMPCWTPAAPEITTCEAGEIRCHAATNCSIHGMFKGTCVQYYYLDSALGKPYYAGRRNWACPPCIKHSTAHTQFYDFSGSALRSHHKEDHAGHNARHISSTRTH